MAALLAGQGVSEVAAQYRVPKATVSRMKKNLSREQLDRVGTERAEKIEGLVFGYLTQLLSSLKAQAEVAADKSYLKQFPPQQLAVVHGVMADKGIRLIEAMSPTQQPKDQSAEPEEDGDGEDETG